MFSFSSERFFFDFFLPLVPFFFNSLAPFSLASTCWGGLDSSATSLVTPFEDVEVSIDLLLVIDSWCSVVSSEPLLKEFSKLSAFDDDVIDEVSSETVFFFVTDLLFTDFLTVFLTTVDSLSKLSSVD